MTEDPRITLLKLKLSEIAENLTNKKQALERAKMELYTIEQKRDNLNTEISNLTYQAESIQQQIHELYG